MSDLPDDDLDRLLGAWQAPPLSDDFAARVAGEASRPDRPRLPPAVAPRRTGRRWTRRGVWTGIVAFNLVLASAVAAAFGGGALNFAPIRRVAARVIEHIAPHDPDRLARAHRTVSAPPHGPASSAPRRPSIAPGLYAFHPQVGKLALPARTAPGGSARLPQPVPRTLRAPDHSRAVVHAPLYGHGHPSRILRHRPQQAGWQDARHPAQSRGNRPSRLGPGEDRARFRQLRPRFEDEGGRFERPSSDWRDGGGRAEGWRGGRFAGPRWRDRGGYNRQPFRDGGRGGRGGWRPRGRF